MNGISVSSITTKQKQLLVEKLQEKPHLVKASFDGFANGKKKYYADWQEVANALNANGSERSSLKWREYWRGLRKRTKAKYIKIKDKMSKTGGGPASLETLDSIEEAILTLIETTQIIGNNDINESFVEWVPEEEMSTEDGVYNINSEDEIIEIDAEEIECKEEKEEKKKLEKPISINRKRKLETHANFKILSNHNGRRRRVAQQKAADIIASCTKENIRIQEQNRKDTLQFQEKALELGEKFHRSLEDGKINCCIS